MKTVAMLVVALGISCGAAFAASVQTCGAACVQAKIDAVGAEWMKTVDQKIESAGYPLDAASQQALFGMAPYKGADVAAYSRAGVTVLAYLYAVQSQATIDRNLNATLKTYEELRSLGAAPEAYQETRQALDSWNQAVEQHQILVAGLKQLLLQKGWAAKDAQGVLIFNVKRDDFYFRGT